MVALSPSGVLIEVFVVQGMNGVSFCVHWPKATSAVRRLLVPSLKVAPMASVTALLSGGRAERRMTGRFAGPVAGAG